MNWPQGTLSEPWGWAERLAQGSMAYCSGSIGRLLSIDVRGWQGQALPALAVLGTVQPAPCREEGDLRKKLVLTINRSF
jgi:hypothetical protein